MKKLFAVIGKLLLAVVIVVGVLSILGFIGGTVFGNIAVDKDMHTYTVDSDINNLYIDIQAADVTIKQGESFSVESNLKKLEVSDSGSTLSVKHTKKFFGNYNNAVLIITLPSDRVFESVKIITGAGVLNIDSLGAESLECDFGAGEINIDKLTVTKRADIDGGAGEINILSGEFCNLDFDMGVGELNFTAKLLGTCEFDLGLGESNITLLGAMEDYTLNIEKGLGSISVDGKTLSSAEWLGSGANKVEIEGGVGAINVKFK